MKLFLLFALSGVLCSFTFYKTVQTEPETPAPPPTELPLARDSTQATKLTQDS